eukprot:366178-Chlamydomonas_euryale.AAC.14
MRSSSSAIVCASTSSWPTMCWSVADSESGRSLRLRGGGTSTSYSPPSSCCTRVTAGGESQAVAGGGGARMCAAACAPSPAPERPPIGRGEGAGSARGGGAGALRSGTRSWPARLMVGAT